MSGVSRRNWARNENAIETVQEWNNANQERGHITEPRVADNDLVKALVDGKLEG